MEQYWLDRKVLVTGATGLVGSCLTRALLEKGAEVVILLRDPDPQSELLTSGDLQKTRVVSGSLEDFSSIERAISMHEVGTVFHLAAQTLVGAALRSPLATFEANVRGTYHLLEACRQHRSLVKSIVIASSDKAYGESACLPYTEEMPLLAKYPYDVSKACADLIALSYFHTYHLPLAIARCGNIYGGGDLNWSRLIPGTIRSLYLDKPPQLRSDGTARRDYLFIKDAIDAYLLLAEGLMREEVRGQVFNFGCNAPVSVLEIVQRIQVLMDRADLQPQILAISQGEICSQALSSCKAQKVLGWKPTFSLEEGLARAIDWYAQYFESASALCL